jgi:hypothetical protein
MGRRSRLLVLVTAALLAFPAASAAATLSFDDLPGGTDAVTTQYVASQGVEFRAQPAPGPGALPRLSTLAAHSGTHSLCIACIPGTEFPHAYLGGWLSQTRSALSFSIRNATTPHITTAWHVTVTLIRADGSTAATQPFAFTDGKTSTWHTASIASAASDAVRFEVVNASNEAGQQLLVDDLVLTGAAGPADVSLAATLAPITYVPRAGQVQIPLSMTRINGSTGRVQLSTSGTGAVQASFSPNPVPDTAGAVTMTLTGTAGAGAGILTITATPLDLTAGTTQRTLSFPVQTTDPFTVAATTATSLTLAPCASATVRLNVTHFPGVVADVQLSATQASPAGPLPPDVSVAFDPPSVSSPDPTAVTATIARGDANGTDVAYLQLVGRATGWVDRPYVSAAVHRTPLRLDGVSSTGVSAPIYTQPGTTVTVTGEGFCPGTTVEFGNDHARAPALPGATNTRIQVVVPALATSGALVVRTPGGSTATWTSPVTVRTFRNTYGFRFHNNPYTGPGFLGVNGGDFSMYHDLYGANIDLHIDFCPPFGCNVVLPIPDPLALIYIPIANAALSGGNGSCYGFALESGRLAQTPAQIRSFEPTGAATIWGLADAPAINRAIDVQHQAQSSSEAIHFAWAQAAAGSAGLRTATTLRADIAEHLAVGDAPMVILAQGDKGHVVVAYRIDPPLPGDPAGSYRIRVYDMNEEYLPAEDTDGALHQTVEDRSSLLITADSRWRFDGLEHADHSPWVGDLSGLFSYSTRDLPVHPHPPFAGDLFTVIFGAGTSSSVTTPNVPVRRDGALPVGVQRLVIPDGPPNGPPAYVLPAKGSFRLAGTADGEGREHLVGMGRETLADVDLTGAVGGAGTLVVGPGGGDVTLARTAGADAPLRVRLATVHGGVTRLADLHTTSGASGTDGLVLQPSGDLRYTHAGPIATVTLDLSTYGGAALPGTVVGVPVTIGDGETLEAAPDWTRLGARPVVATVTGPAGKRTVPLTRPATRPRVRLGVVRVTSTSHGLVATVRARVRGAAGGRVVVTVIARSGRRVIGQVSRVLAGKTTVAAHLALRLKRAATRVEVRVTAFAASALPVAGSAARIVRPSRTARHPPRHRRHFPA